MTTPELTEKIVRYLCISCEQIVRLDLSEEIQTSSSTARPKIPHATRILVVDDSPSFLEMVEILLTKAGFEVFFANDGAEGLKKIAEEHPDAILLDLLMPKMSGFEVLRALKTSHHYKNYKHIPVLVTSGAYNQAESQILHDLGANGFISKDAIPEFLVYRIKKLLERTDKIPKPQLPLINP
jgi:CheY-like chemotaxis protein